MKLLMRLLEAYDKMSNPESLQLHTQLPNGLRHMETQVAGHIYEPTKAASIGLLQDSVVGCVLKPLGKPECGERELRFYESLQTADAADGDELLAEVRAFVAKYYEKVNLIVNKHVHAFLKLEDMTHGMSKPCIMDIKIGRRTWDPLASQQKREVEEQKYAQCKQVLGLCLPGFQVYVPNPENPNDEPTLIRHGRDYGKSLNTDGFRKTMALFLNIADTPRHPATVIFIQEILHQLYQIRDWFTRQKLLHFYASSLLITYDFTQLQMAKCSTITQLNGIATRRKNTMNGIHTDGDKINDKSSIMIQNCPVAHWTKVRMIDFAHVFPAENATTDMNYLFGLQNLIKVIEELLNG